MANPLSADPIGPSPVLPYCCVWTLWITGDGDKSRGRGCVRAVATLTASGLQRRENMILQTMICSGGDGDPTARRQASGGKRDVYDRSTFGPSGTSGYRREKRGDGPNSLPASFPGRATSPAPCNGPVPELFLICERTKTPALFPCLDKRSITIIHDTMEKLCSAGFAFSRSVDPRLFDKLGRGRCRIQMRRSSFGFA